MQKPWKILSRRCGSREYRSGRAALSPATSRHRRRKRKATATSDTSVSLPRESQNNMTKDLLRFITCGSVDDGKSTLIGRLLNDSQLIHEDHLATLAKDSLRHGTAADGIDFALLVDGLEAEREQGITIDVAYRFFTTATRLFI